MIPCPLSALNTFALSKSTRRGSLNLLHHLIPRVDIINNSEEACNFCLVTRHYFQKINKIVSLSGCKKSQFVDIMPIAHFIHFHTVLL